MKTLLYSTLALLVLVWLNLGQTPAVAREASAPGQSLTPLENLLQPDGTLNLQMGFQGSLDSTGWTMVSEPGQPPRFGRVSNLDEFTNGSALNSFAAAPGDENWDPNFGVLGANNVIHVIAVSGSDVYFGGIFSTIGGIQAKSVAKWNSATGQWSDMGGGVYTPPGGGGFGVFAIAVNGSDVYVGGPFSRAGRPGNELPVSNIARWNGAAWSDVGRGVNAGGVNAIAIGSDGVYVGGQFSMVYNCDPFIPTCRVSVNNLARWNGSVWLDVGGGISSPIITYPRISAIAVSGTDVYVGGEFTLAGSISANHIAKWSSLTETWSSLGSGVDGPYYHVAAIAVSGSDVYVGGNFTHAGGMPITDLARWNTTTGTWSQLGNGMDNPGVNAIAVNGNEVYVGYYGEKAGGVNAPHIAIWNSVTNTWSPLGSGMNNAVNAIGIGVDGVYVGGAFTTAGGKPSNRIGLWHTGTTPPTCPADSFDNLIPGPLAGQNGWVTVPGRSSATVMANPYGSGRVLLMDAGPKQTVIMEKNVNDQAQGTHTVELAVLVDKPCNEALKSLAKLEIKTRGNPNWDKKFQLYFGTHMRLNFGPTPSEAVEFLSSQALVSKRWYKVKAIVDLNANPNRVDIYVDDQPKLQDIAIGPGPITHISISAWDRPGLVLFDDLYGCGESSATAMPESTFDSSTEGWTVIGAAQAGSATPDFIPTGGNPGGYISAKGDVPGSVWYWQAPAKFLGDASGAYGKALNFDLRQSMTDNQFDGEDIILEGGGLKLVYDTPYNPGPNWTAFSIPLVETAGWKKDTLNDPPPTSAEMQAVLVSLTLLRIRGDYRNGADTGDLDNAMLHGVPKGVGPSFFTSYYVDDDMQGNSQGDGDGQIEPGERVELAIDLTNQGIQTATGVTATLVSSDSDITVFDNDNTWPDIPDGTSQLSVGSFGLEVASNLAEEKLVTFVMTVTASNGSPWTSTFDLLIGPRSTALFLPIILR